MSSTSSALHQYYQRKQQIEADLELPVNFSQLLVSAASRFPENDGINYFDQGRKLNFAQLQQQVFSLAEGLNSIGIGKGSHVAVLLNNRIEFPVTWLALGVLGAVMLPVNTRYTGSELDYLVNDGDAEYFISEPSLMGAFDDMQQRPDAMTDAHVVVVDGEPNAYHDWTTLQALGSGDYRPNWEVATDDLMNIQYTSGTTGFPKGCMQSQRYWILLGCSAFELYGKVRSILSDHPFFYMDPQWQLILAIYTGACIYAPSRLSSSKFMERINNYNIEMSFFPRPLISTEAKPEDRNTSLKKLFAMGVGAAGQKKLTERFNIPVLEGYGMTEIGPGLIVPEELQHDPAIAGQCGVPAPFREVKVVADDDGNEADTGEAGELWIRGDSILKGYYNKPEANASSFHNGWFKTGDLFIRDKNGYYRIVGRKKDMIRRSSENISALEVEQALSTHPKIQQAAAVPVPDDYRGEEVKVYLLLREGESVDTLSPQEVIAHSKERLAAFKLPRFIEYVREFPLTPSEKVAKHKLVSSSNNLRANSWDALQGNWLGANGEASNSCDDQSQV